jgi:HEAT repeat protein
MRLLADGWGLRARGVSGSVAPYACLALLSSLPTHCTSLSANEPLQKPDPAASGISTSARDGNPSMMAAARELQHALSGRWDDDLVPSALARVAANPGAEYFCLDAILRVHRGAYEEGYGARFLSYSEIYPRLAPFVRDILKREPRGIDVPWLFALPLTADSRTSWDHLVELLPSLDEQSRLAGMRAVQRLVYPIDFHPRIAAASKARRLQFVQERVVSSGSVEFFLPEFEALLPGADLEARLWLASALARALPSSLPELLDLANDSEPSVRRAALEVLGSAIPPGAWVEPRMLRPLPDQGAQALGHSQGRPSAWRRLRREMERFVVPTLERAVADRDEVVRIQACRILIKSALRWPALEAQLARHIPGESPIASAWRRFASDGCSLTVPAMLARAAPRGSTPRTLPTEALALERLRAELESLSASRGRSPAERLEAAEHLAEFVPRDFARDRQTTFLGRPLVEVQTAIAEAAVDCALQWMFRSCWGPPYADLDVIRRHARVVVPVIGAEWLLAQELLHGGMDDAMWNAYGPLLALLGEDGAGMLAIGAEVQWVGVDEHIDWCRSNRYAARMLVPLLPGLWRHQLQPWPEWRLRQTSWDDWSSPLASSFIPRESWTSKVVRVAGPEAAPFLRPSLDDPIALVRRRACQAFEALGTADEETTRRIAVLLDDEDVWVRFFAAKALYAIAVERKELRARAEMLLRQY